MRFGFRFGRWHRVLGIPFGITPNTTMVEVADGRLTARLGPWVLQTPVTNIVDVTETGPFALLKTAGPAHLSLADRGLTMATNLDQGLCIRFRTPVRGLDPFGWLRHPGLTVTVERVAELRRLIEDGEEPAKVPSLAETTAGRSPWQTAARWARWPAGMALAAARYFSSIGSVRRSLESCAGPPPKPLADRDADLQSIDQGVGSAYERTYRVAISGTDLTPEQLLDLVASDLNMVAPTEVAEFQATAPDHAKDAVGQEYLVRMPGPWNARVRVLDRGPTSLLLATLEGHMEAGEIQFTTGRVEPGEGQSGNGVLYFEVRSVARSGDQAFRLVYWLLSLGKRMQEYMWVEMCRRVLTLADGQRHGAICVHTIRYAR